MNENSTEERVNFFYQRRKMGVVEKEQKRQTRWVEREKRITME
jgi:hypothetical protein